MAELFPKRCKVYPRNGLQFIPGILEKQKRIEFPAELPLSEKELRRCLSYADVYEVTDSGDVLLTIPNYLSDNSKATPAKDVPEDELQYPRDKKEENDDENESEDISKEVVSDIQSKSQFSKNINVKASVGVNSKINNIESKNTQQQSQQDTKTKETENDKL